MSENMQLALLAVGGYALYRRMTGQPILPAATIPGERLLAEPRVSWAFERDASGRVTRILRTVGGSNGSQ